MAVRKGRCPGSPVRSFGCAKDLRIFGRRRRSRQGLGISGFETTFRAVASTKQLKPQGNDVEAQAISDRVHQPFMFRVLKLDNFTSLDIDQVVMRSFLSRFITGTPATEVTALQDTLFLEQADSAVANTELQSKYADQARKPADKALRRPDDRRPLTGRARQLGVGRSS